MTAHEWTAAMIGFFTDLHDNPARLSFTDIASAMNAEFGLNLSRNACIGKAHRLGLPARGPHQRQRKLEPTGARMTKRRQMRIDAPIPPLEAVVVSGDEPLTIHQLREGDCHWPLEPFEAYPPYTYCGKRCEIGSSWCFHHASRAYNKPRVTWE